MCCPGLGCFNNQPPFDDLPLPMCPDKIQPEFHLYTRLNFNERQYITRDKIPYVHNKTRVDILTLPMLRLFSSKEQGCNHFWNPTKPCHVGIHWITLVECCQMITNVPSFQSFFRFFASFCIGQISHQQHKGFNYPYSPTRRHVKTSILEKPQIFTNLTTNN